MGRSLLSLMMHLLTCRQECRGGVKGHTGYRNSVNGPPGACTLSLPPIPLLQQQSSTGRYQQLWCDTEQRYTHKLNTVLQANMMNSHHEVWLKQWQVVQVFALPRHHSWVQKTWCPLDHPAIWTDKTERFSGWSKVQNAIRGWDAFDIIRCQQ